MTPDAVATLAMIQRQLTRLITAPDGVDAALEVDGDASGEGLAQLVRGDRALATAARVAIYADAYFARLHDGLRDDFEALAGALGPDAFHDLVKTYLMMTPPTQTSLRHAGDRLAEHLASEPFGAIFARVCPYAADLAGAMAGESFAALCERAAATTSAGDAARHMASALAGWIDDELLVCSVR